MAELVALFTTFFKIGAFSFGGGYAMIPFFEHEIAAHRWAMAADYVKMIAVAQLIPGPFAVDSAAYIGYKVNGLAGAIVASVALAAPSFLILLLVARYYMQFRSNLYVKIALESVRPAVIALLIGAAYIIGVQPWIKPALRLDRRVLIAIGLMGLGVWLLKKTKLNPLAFIALFALAGIVLF